MNTCDILIKTRKETLDYLSRFVASDGRRRAGSLLPMFLLALAALSFIPLNPAHALVQSQVSVQTYSNNLNSQIFGYYATLWENGVMVSSCYSTCSFTVDNGPTYQVAVSDYGNECFSHWSDGSTNRFYTFSFSGQPSTSVVFQAFFSSCNTGTSQLTINTQDTNGNPITGYYTVLNQSSNVQATGYTPATFNLQNGQTYTQ